MLEGGLAAELTGHLGYERGGPTGRGSGNSRDGTTAKTVATEVGEAALGCVRVADADAELVRLID